MSAIISECGLYRYRLERDLKERGFVTSVIMVNPSTADASEDDATIRKLKGFGDRLGWRKIIVANLFAFRATDVRMVGAVDRPVGPMNNEHILMAMLESDITVVAWGASGKLPQHLRNRWRIVTEIADALKRDLWCIGVCNDGHPKHPVMGPYCNMLTKWSAPK